MTTLLFARHGQASFGQSNYDKLSPLGEKQAAFLGSHYGFTQRKIDAIVSGSLVRQQHSAMHFLNAYTQQGIVNPRLPEPKIIEPFNEFNHKDVFIKFNPSFATEDRKSVV